MTNQAISHEAIIILIIAMSVVLLVVGAFIANVWIPFAKRVQYLKMEIKRSDGEERKHYEKSLKMFYISCIPLIGRIIIKREEKRNSKKKR